MLDVTCAQDFNKINKAKNKFVDGLRKMEVQDQVKFTLNVWKGLGLPVIDVSVMEDSYL